MTVVLLLALAAAVLYGASDFLGGLLSRRASYLLVGLVGQCAAAVGAVAAALAVGSALPGAAVLAWGLGAGLGGAVGTLALYRGLALGRMNVAGPLSAVGAAGIPVLAAVLFGQRLTVAVALGAALALPGIWLVSSQSGARGTGGVAEGLLAGLGFAGLFVCLDRAGDSAGLWPVATGQVAAVAVLATVALASRAALARRPVAVAHPAQIASAALVTAPGALTSPPWTAIWPGLLGVGATILYFLAVRQGSLAVAAVITSLYPAITVVLAAVVLRERTTVAHGVGLLLCAGAVGAFVVA